MKITAQEEYGIRCLLQLACCGGRVRTIPEIAESESLSKDYVAKLMRVLRRGKLVRSVRGRTGGYVLARPPAQITLSEALTVLGGKLWESSFCKRHPGRAGVCRRISDCGVRVVWRRVQEAVEAVLGGMTLQDFFEALAAPPGSDSWPQAGLPCG